MNNPGDETRPSERRSDPTLRAQTERILAMPIEERLRQLEEEANFFLSVRPLADDSEGAVWPGSPDGLAQLQRLLRISDAER